MFGDQKHFSRSEEAIQVILEHLGLLCRHLLTTFTKVIHIFYNNFRHFLTFAPLLVSIHLWFSSFWEKESPSKGHVTLEKKALLCIDLARFHSTVRVWTSQREDAENFPCPRRYLVAKFGAVSRGLLVWQYKVVFVFKNFLSLNFIKLDFEIGKFL